MSAVVGAHARDLDRPFALAGATYQSRVATAEGEVVVLITVNDNDGLPYELFLTCRDARLAEHLTLVSLLATRLLRAGVAADEVAADLLSIQSPFTGHFASGSYCPSLAARIGQVLKHHLHRATEHKLPA